MLIKQIINEMQTLKRNNSKLLTQRKEKKSYNVELHTTIYKNIAHSVQQIIQE